MRCRGRWPLAERLLAAGLLWCALAGVARAADGDVVTPNPLTQRLVLAASYNGTAAVEPVLVRRQGPSVWMRAADLRGMGMRLPGDGVDVALASVPGLRFVIDEGTQTIALTQSGIVQQVRIDDAAPGSPAVTRSDWGAAFNYDLAVSHAGRATVAAGLVDAAIYGAYGYFYAGAVVTTERGGGQRQLTRLDTGFTAGNRDTARRITIGDTITGATEQSRPVRLAGIQVATDFDLRPDLVTYPVPAVTGSAAVPSAVDLIVNGGRRSAGQVRAGQFAVTDVPMQTGLNSVTVAVRDALGRETRQTVSSYVSRALLRPGLFAYSVEAGFVRVAYATRADRYADPAASGSLRAGLSDRLTAETHLELGARVGVGTAGVSIGLGAAGMLSASAGASVAAATDRHGGTQIAVGYERVGRPVSIAAHYLRQTLNWYDLASDHGAVTRAHLFSATLGFDLGSLGNVGLTLIDQGRGRLTPPADPAARGLAMTSSLPATTLVTATYSVRVARRVNLVASGGIDARVRRSGYLSIGALLVFGRRSNAYAGMLARSSGTSGDVAYSHVATGPGEWGYRVDAARGGIDRLAAEASYQGPSGYYTAQIERTNGVSAARVSARGAVILDGAGVLAADRLTGSFAVVDTHGQAGVPVFRDNHRVGKTDRRGRLVVTNLRAYEPTKISLDPLLIGESVLIDRTEQWVTPAMRSGVTVRFVLRTSRPARVSLVGADGAPVPAGSRATANGGPDLPVGLDGELYLEDAGTNNAVTVRLRGGGRCAARFTVGSSAKPLTRVGPVTCVAERVVAR